MPRPEPRRSHAFGWFMTVLCLLLAVGVALLIIGLTTQPFTSPLHSSL